MHTGVINKNECENLSKILGDSAPSSCSIYRHGIEDPFSVPKDETFKGEDAEKHRQSWLWPRFARRLTKKSDQHVSKWQKPASISSDECAVIREALAKLGKEDDLPKSCKE